MKKLAEFILSGVNPAPLAHHVEIEVPIEFSEHVRVFSKLPDH